VNDNSGGTRAKLQIDHVTLAGPDLAIMQARFAELGLDAEYGGPHSNGITHMALLGFKDGSYIELISTRVPNTRSPLWNAQVQDNAGPAAWAVRSNDLFQERARLSRAGVAARGPVFMTRDRPDGTALEWDLLFPGDGEPGATLPFAICDRTPRELRVAASPSAARSGIGGIAAVVVGVASMDATGRLFEQAYALGGLTVTGHSGLGARIGCFADVPVYLAEPLPGESWLSERIARYGDSPAAVLLDSSPNDQSKPVVPLLPTEDWFGQRVAWIDPAKLFGWRVGLIFPPT
jgi:Glyoxalase-like domain